MQRRPGQVRLYWKGTKAIVEKMEDHRESRSVTYLLKFV